ncbi:hypothetical protein T484DRAFT_2903878 [Baffinella frigidus]|nr:hypothetical protein T484DRAFT_2903878 [Cryptophyta sp. CCMP2293]
MPFLAGEEQRCHAGVVFRETVRPGRQKGGDAQGAALRSRQRQWCPAERSRFSGAWHAGVCCAIARRKAAAGPAVVVRGPALFVCRLQVSAGRREELKNLRVPQYSRNRKRRHSLGSTQLQKIPPDVACHRESQLGTFPAFQPQRPVEAAVAVRRASERQRVLVHAGLDLPPLGPRVPAGPHPAPPLGGHAAGLHTFPAVSSP